MSTTRRRLLRGAARLLPVALLLAVSAHSAFAAEGKRLKVGITLHPYYSFVANIVGDRADIVPLIDGHSNPHNYTPVPDDMKRVTTMDVLVVNGIGHDEWAFDIVKAGGREKNLPLIYANDGVALIPIAQDEGQAKVVNPHTFVSTTAAIQQIYTIAKGLGEIDKANAAFYRENARNYAARIRKMKAEYSAKLADVDVAGFRCATMHGGYGYLMQEFGLQVTAVIEPRHGVEPTARQLAETIDRIKAANVQVLFAEKFFASKLADTIKQATGVQMYSFSHMSEGDYAPELYEREMRQNLETLVQAIHDVAGKKSGS